MVFINFFRAGENRAISGPFSCSQGGGKITRFLTTGWHIPHKRRVSCLSHSFRAGDSSRFIPLLSGLFSCPQSREDGFTYSAGGQDMSAFERLLFPQAASIRVIVPIKESPITTGLPYN